MAPDMRESRRVSESDTPSEAAPKLRLEESSAPMAPPQKILTLSSDDISHFFVRVRRDQDSERWEVRLDAALREILERANDFVPSESGGILLDDPRAKLAGSPTPPPDLHRRLRRRLAELLGSACPATAASSVRSTVGPSAADRSIGARRSAGLRTACIDCPRARRAVRVRVDLAVPVIVGDSICGVLQLTNRRSGGPYTRARQGAASHLRRVHVVVDPERARRHPQPRAGPHRRPDGPVQQPLLPHPAAGRDWRAPIATAAELSILFIDLDSFKPVNDRFGHMAGSWTLREVARVMAEEAPPGDGAGPLRRRRVRGHLAGRQLAQAVQTAELCGGPSPRRPSLDVDPSPVTGASCCPASGPRSGSRPIATTWRRAATSAARERAAAPGRRGHVPGQGERPQPRRGRRSRGVGPATWPRRASCQLEAGGCG